MKTFLKYYNSIKEFLEKCKADNIPAIAGQSAFFLILSLVPFIMFTVAVLSFLNVPQDAFDVYFSEDLPEVLRNFIQGLITEAYNTRVGIAFTTIIAALWSSGKGLYAVMQGINRIYLIKKRTNWLLNRVFAMGYMLILFALLLLSLGGFVALEFFNKWLRSAMPSLPKLVSVLYLLRYPLMFVLLTLLICAALSFYLRRRVEDKAEAKFLVQLPGAVLTSFLWILLVRLIGVYADYFGGFSIYGSLATLAIVMMWMYFSMYIFLMGVELNHNYRNRIIWVLRKRKK